MWRQRKGLSKDVGSLCWVESSASILWMSSLAYPTLYPQLTPGGESKWFKEVGMISANNPWIICIASDFGLVYDQFRWEISVRIVSTPKAFQSSCKISQDILFSKDFESLVNCFTVLSFTEILSFIWFREANKNNIPEDFTKWSRLQ